MMKRLMHMLEGTDATIVSGLGLAASLALVVFDIHTKYDPAWVSIVVSGLPLFHSALRRLIGERRITSALLISTAMVACVAIGEVFAAGEVAFIMAIGELLEDYTVDRARRGLSQLIALAPLTARRLCQGTGEEEMVRAERLAVGDVVRVLPGEKIGVDGVVVSGATAVDQSIMTGESLPKDVGVGDRVFCGTMNCNGSIDIRAVRVGEESSLQRMIALVREAEKHKAPTQRIVDVWAAWLVPVALVIAVATWLVTGDITRGVTILVVFCPCALALATPVSIVAGIGQATKHGVLIKSGEALELMGKADTVAFDKTGTLTRGVLSVSDVRPVSGVTSEELLLAAASAEARSEHPIGKALVRACTATPLEVDTFAMRPGLGIEARVSGTPYACGCDKFMRILGVDMGEARVGMESLQSEGKAVVCVAREGVCIGVIGLSDVVRPEARNVVRELRAMGVRCVMLTGDNRLTASTLASAVGLDDVRAELLPADKVSAVDTLQGEGRKVCMVGDGVNDAPALKMASVGVAMASVGSDVATECADIALMGDDISRLPYLTRLSRAVIRAIKLNITLSMLINLVAIVLSVAGVLGPVSGALWHNAGSVLVVLNAALLYDRKV